MLALLDIILHLFRCKRTHHFHSLSGKASKKDYNCIKLIINMLNRDQTTTDIRIRSILIYLLIQSIIAITSTYESATSNLTYMLKYHLFIDAIVLTSSFVMLLSLAYFVLIISFLAILFDSVIFFLMVSSIVKCINIYQSNTCYSTFVQDIIITSILGIVVLFDVLQLFSNEIQRQYLSLKKQDL